MSTKTLRKRIALVAVTALGAGILSVAPANAVALTLDNGNNVVTASAACADTQVATALETGVIPVGSYVSFSVPDTTYAILSGPALVTSVTNATSSLNANGMMTFLGTAGDGVVTISANAVGTITIVDAGASSVTASTTSNSAYLTVVATCTTSTLAVSKSFVSVTNDYTDTAWGATPTNVDASTVSTGGASLYVRVLASNQYLLPVPTGIWGVSATNGALVSIGTDVTNARPDSGILSVAVLSAADQINVRVAPKTAGVPQTSTVSVTYNGVAVTTKTLTFFGEATKVSVVGGVTGLLGSVGYIFYALTDAIGNKVPGSVTFDATSATSRFTSATSSHDPTLATFTLGTTVLPAGVGVISYSCSNNYGSGTADLKFTHIQDVSEADLALTATATCAGLVDTYTLSTDKASYKVGDIATVTITAKDSSGVAVSDSATVATGATISAGGMTQIGTLSTADKFTAGVKTYTFQVTTGGAFNAVATLAGTTTKSATAAYSVISGDVQMSEVLKAIVSLIASINKQIAALQKALLKK